MINGNTIGRWLHVEANIVTPDKSHPDKHTHIGKQAYTVYVYFLVSFLLRLMVRVTDDWYLVITLQLSSLVIVSLCYSSIRS